MRNLTDWLTALHKAMDMAAQGDVIVVDGGGEVTHAPIGEMMLNYARGRGIAGFVLNGAIRDADAFLEVNPPSYAVGVTHRGPYKNGPGGVNCPIAIGGMVVMPGDLVLGDADGVVVVPIDDVADVYEKAVAKHAAETKQMDALAVGLGTLMVAFASATQDIVIDAFRIESLDQDEQAAGMASYVAAYRVALLVSDAGRSHSRAGSKRAASARPRHGGVCKATIARSSPCRGDIAPPGMTM